MSMKLFSFWARVVWLIGVVPLCARADDSVTPQPAVETFGSQIASVLEIRNTKADVLSPLADAMTAFKKDPNSSGAAIGALVNAILAGPEPESLVNQILPTVQIEFRSGAQQLPGWKYGDYKQRLDLNHFIWKLAKDVRTTDTQKSQKLGRAAVMFAALNDYQHGWLSIKRFRQDKEFNLIVSLTDQQATRLATVMEERLKQQSVWMDKYELALRGIDSINSTNIGSIDSVKDVLEHLDEGIRKGPSQDGDRWVMITTAWTLLNSPKVRENSKLEAMVRDQLSTWERDFKNSNVSRWVGQAFERKTNPPEKLIRDYELGPDGKVTEKKTPPTSGK